MRYIEKEMFVIINNIGSKTIYQQWYCTYCIESIIQTVIVKVKMYCSRTCYSYPNGIFLWACYAYIRFTHREKTQLTYILLNHVRLRRWYKSDTGKFKWSWDWCKTVVTIFFYRYTVFKIEILKSKDSRLNSIIKLLNLRKKFFYG